MAKKTTLTISESSLEFMLNFTLDNLKEDRELALQHHQVLAGLLHGADGAELSALEVQMMVQELSAALTNFLRSASVSTEQGLKMAKLLADQLSKIDNDDNLTDEERADIETMLGGFEAERDNIINIEKKVGEK